MKTTTHPSPRPSSANPHRVAVSFLLTAAFFALSNLAAQETLTEVALLESDALFVPGTLEPLNFGLSVGISGETIVVGASGTHRGSRRGAGAVFVYRKEGDAWTHVQTLLHPSPSADHEGFGAAVAIDGDTIMASAPGAFRAGSINWGRVYVYRRQGLWNLTQTLGEVRNPPAGSLFGTSITIEGDRAVIGSGPDAGVYTVVRGPANSWSLSDHIPEPSELMPDPTGFGSALALSGSNILIGAHRANRIPGLSGEQAGIVFRAETALGERLDPPDPALNLWGRFLDLEGDRALVSSGSFTGGSNGMHFLEGGQWQHVWIDDEIAGVALEGNAAVATGRRNDQGYLVVRSQGGWRLSHLLRPSEPNDLALFAQQAPAMDGETAVIGGTDFFGDGVVLIFKVPVPEDAPELLPQASITLLPTEQISLSIETLPNFEYEIEYSDDLVDWISLQVLAGDGTRQEALFVPPGQPSAQSYRIVVRPQ